MTDIQSFVLVAIISFVILLLLKKVNMLEGALKFVGVVLLGFGAVAFICALMAYPTKWLWNYVMPYLFNVPEISVLQALALVVLANILFGKSSSSSKKD